MGFIIYQQTYYIKYITFVFWARYIVFFLFLSSIKTVLPLELKLRQWPTVLGVYWKKLSLYFTENNTWKFLQIICKTIAGLKCHF